MTTKIATVTTFAAGDRVEGGEGEDWDVGTVGDWDRSAEAWRGPQPEGVVWVHWDTGVSTPAVAENLRHSKPSRGAGDRAS